MKITQAGSKPQSIPRYAALFAFLGALPSACTFNPSDRCGPHQVIYGDNLRCVCDATSVMTDAGCVPCAEDEVPGPAGCACKPGFTKSTADAVCAPAPEGLGTPCDASAPCADATFNHCEAVTGGSGYCTSTGCAVSEECGGGGYICDTAVSPSVCRRPPTGLLKSCDSDAACAGTEATYCDLFVSHACLVQGCSLTPNNCFVGYQCCDLTSVGVPQLLCVPQGNCPQ